MSNVNIEKTEFVCQICNKKQQIDITDETSYISKTIHKEFFGMKLETYRIEHLSQNERHVNVILVDQKGLFRGYIDSYKEELDSKAHTEDQEFNLNTCITIGEEIESIVDDEVLDYFIILNNSKWFLEVAKTKNMNVREVTKLVLNKITESRKVYHELPKPLKISVADLEFQVYVTKDFVIILSLKDKQTLENFTASALMLSERYCNSAIPPRKRTLKLLVEILKQPTKSELDQEVLYRLLSDDLFYIKIKTKYKDRISQIVSKIISRYEVKEEIITPVLEGRMTIMEALEQDRESLLNYRDFMEVVDYINRRKMLS